jgi:cation/acetate symporter
MVAGLGLTAYYIAVNASWLRGWLGLADPPTLWFGIVPVCAGVFGVAAGVAVLVAVSLATRQGSMAPAVP